MTSPGCNYEVKISSFPDREALTGADMSPVSRCCTVQLVSCPAYHTPFHPYKHNDSRLVSCFVFFLFLSLVCDVKCHCTFSACTLTRFSRDCVSAALQYRLTKRLILLMQASLQMQFIKFPELSRAQTAQHSQHRNAFPARGASSLPGIQ